MREFIYKAIIITFIFIVAFEFTVGKRIDPIAENLNKVSNEQGRKELINKLRKEMRKGIEKEYILNEEDRVLINKFINKISSEINNPSKN
jgi:hypothetical protein